MTKKPPQGAPTNGGKPMEVLIDQIAPSRFQRRVFDDAAKARLGELAASIKADGILQRPLVIKSPNNKRRPYELVFGERRLRAAKMAGLDKIPVELVDWPDSRIRQAHLAENAQREDLHDLEQAAEYLELQNSQTPPMTIRELALRVSQSERETARIVALNNLIDKAGQYLREGKITRGHADQLARLSPDVQPQALDQCFEQEHLGWDQKTRQNKYRPNLDALITVRQLVKWISKSLTMDLSKVPWSLDDDTLVPAQGACTNCPYNTAANQLLFGDAAEAGAAICTNSEGFRKKMDAWIGRQIATLTTDATPLTLVFHHQNHYIAPALQKKWPDALFLGSYHVAEGKGNTCSNSKQALYLSGENEGRTVQICVEPSCPSHAGRRVSNSSPRSTGPRTEKSPAERQKFNERKQEIFNIKVDEETRRVVLRQAMETFKAGPIDRTWRERMAAEAFVRLPHNDSDLINELMGVEFEQSSLDIADLMAQLKKLSDLELARLTYLCACVHYGANFGGQHAVDQSKVIALAKERGLNHPLVDADARLRLSSKKYSKRHEEHLQAVMAGRKSAVPLVYDPPEAVSAVPGKKKQPSAKRGSKAAAKKPASKSKKAAKKR